MVPLTNQESRQAIWQKDMCVVVELGRVGERLKLLLCIIRNRQGFLQRHSSSQSTKEGRDPRGHGERPFMWG